MKTAKYEKVEQIKLFHQKWAVYLPVIQECVRITKALTLDNAV
jgi:hypothetical protein